MTLPKDVVPSEREMPVTPSDRGQKETSEAGPVGNRGENSLSESERERIQKEQAGQQQKRAESKREEEPFETPPPQARISIFQSVFLVIVLLGVDLAVLWFLNTKIRPASPVKSASEKSTFQGKFKAMGGTITVAAAGSIGSFLTLLVVTIAAVMVLSKFG
jgi:hypothetical protein